jgi:hypothetical protein
MKGVGENNERRLFHQVCMREMSEEKTFPGFCFDFQNKLASQIPNKLCLLLSSRDPAAAA